MKADLIYLYFWYTSTRQKQAFFSITHIISQTYHTLHTYFDWCVSSFARAERQFFLHFLTFIQRVLCAMYNLPGTKYRRHHYPPVAFASDQATVPRDIWARQLIIDQTSTVRWGSLLWKEPFFSLQPQIKIIVELSIDGTRIFHPPMFHHQCKKSCGEKVLVTNLNIARKCHDLKTKKYVPVNVWRWLSHLNPLTLTALACT